MQEHGTQQKNSHRGLLLHTRAAGQQRTQNGSSGAAIHFTEEEIAMKEYFTPELEVLKLYFSDIVTESLTANYMGETNVNDHVVQGDPLIAGYTDPNETGGNIGGGGEMN